MSRERHSDAPFAALEIMSTGTLSTYKVSYMAESAPRKRPRDTNQLAKLVADISTGAVEDREEDRDEGKNPHAVALGRLGGQKGGAARKRALTPRRRKEIARRAAQTRWAARDEKT